MTVRPDEGSYVSVVTQLPILDGHTMPSMRERASDTAADVDTVIAGLSDQYGPPQEVLPAWIRAIKKEYGLKWAAIGMVAGRLTGKTYANPQSAAQAWGDGVSEIPGSVIVALSRAYPKVSLVDFALAKRDDDLEAILRRGDLQAELHRQVRLLSDRLTENEAMVRALANELASALSSRGIEIDVRALAERMTDQQPPDGDGEMAEPGV